MTLAWRNQETVRHWFKNPQVLSWDQHKAWFEARRDDPNDKIFIAECLVDQKSVGQVSVYSIDLERRTAEVGRFIAAPDCGGKGYMKEACCLLLDFCFHELGLRSVHLEVFSHNTRAVGLYRRLGFSLISSDRTINKFELESSRWSRKVMPS